MLQSILITAFLRNMSFKPCPVQSIDPDELYVSAGVLLTERSVSVCRPEPRDSEVSIRDVRRAAILGEPRAGLHFTGAVEP
jgi:hypothetical protein